MTDAFLAGDASTNHTTHVRDAEVLPTKAEAASGVPKPHQVRCSTLTVVRALNAICCLKDANLVVAFCFCVHIVLNTLCVHQREHQHFLAFALPASGTSRASVPLNLCAGI